MRLLALDPGYANCGWCIIEDLQILKFGAWEATSEWTKLSVQQRSCEIAQGLQFVACQLNIDFMATEEFFHGRSPRIVYDRGKHDAYVEIAFGHVMVYKVNPLTLKKFVTGNGRAEKTDMLSAVIDHLQVVDPYGLERVLSVYPKPKNYEHILEAYAIGWLASMVEKYRRGDTDGMKPSTKEVAKRMENKNRNPPFLDTPAQIPSPAR